MINLSKEIFPYFRTFSRILFILKDLFYVKIRTSIWNLKKRKKKRKLAKTPENSWKRGIQKDEEGILRKSLSYKNTLFSRTHHHIMTWTFVPKLRERNKRRWDKTMTMSKVSSTRCCIQFVRREHTKCTKHWPMTLFIGTSESTSKDYAQQKKQKLFLNNKTSKKASLDFFKER